jgi:hypothetical protein
VDFPDLIFFSFPFPLLALAAFLASATSLSSLSRITSSVIITRALVSRRLSLVVALDLWVTWFRNFLWIISPISFLVMLCYKPLFS